MNIVLKNFDDISKIKQAVEIWKEVKKELLANIKPGISLNELDLIAKNKIEELGAIPTFYGYYNYPKNICISVNEVVVHGVPNDYLIKDKDLITFDIGVTFKDHVCDSAFSVIVGENQEAQRISSVCEQAIYEAAAMIKPGVTNLQIAKTIQTFVENNGYEVLRDFTGHGCGNVMHEDPYIPNYYSRAFAEVPMQENMVICIEPMILTGSRKYFIDPMNKWSVIAKNKKLTAHWEHMILITKDGCEILTKED